MIKVLYALFIKLTVFSNLSLCVLRRPSTQFWIKRHKNDCGMWMQNENMPENKYILSKVKKGIKFQLQNTKPVVSYLCLYVGIVPLS